MLSGLTGVVEIPARNASSSTYWIGGDNADSVTESTGTLKIAGIYGVSPTTVRRWSMA